MWKFIRRIINGITNIWSSNSNEESQSDEDPCNVSGHKWGEWKNGPSPAMASGAYSKTQEQQVYQTQYRKCEKCGEYDTRRKYPEYIDIGENVWVSEE